MDLGLHGRRALVTGASRGIGRAIALTLAAEGCALAVCARGKEALAETAEELRQRGAPVHAQSVDVSDPAAVREFVRASAEALGGLDIVVSNASPGSVKGEGAWVASAQGDLQAFAVLADASRPHLARSEGAAVVAIASTSAVDTAFPSGPTAFAAIKAAVLQHASALARSLASEGIRVNTVSPGPVEFEGGAWSQVRDARPEVYRQVLGTVPLGRLGSPEDVASAVAFLVSARASFCTGVNFVVDGGLLSRVQH
ncbi:SDR family oxidoreductase [Actinomadura sp. LD22]|uniref:SDR family oxidoreductase n=1 Tax=Actinomadura physcomitrii TaxID=2650748 RepID=A0A6I4MGD1_9ACTN|nr:SDR family oxidoreductase [Actinomadura physcomitrii]MWA03214.1 SDR family oxidoreductase [Actinomadura physcomitrii]